MAQLTLSWEQFWLYHKNATEVIQKDLMKQLELESFLPRCTEQTKKEVLAYAPMDVQRRLSVRPGNYRADLLKLFNRR